MIQMEKSSEILMFNIFPQALKIMVSMFLRSTFTHSFKNVRSLVPVLLKRH